MTFAIEWCNWENCTSWSWPTFWRSKLKNAHITETVRAGAKCTEWLLHIWIFARFTLNDRLFQGKIYEILISPKKRCANMWTDFKYQAFYQHFSVLKCEWSLSFSCRFAFTCMAPAVELLLYHEYIKLHVSHETNQCDTDTTITSSHHMSHMTQISVTLTQRWHHIITN